MAKSISIYPVCFWCGDTFSEAIVFDSDVLTEEEKKEVPEKCVLHYDPCQKCMNKWQQGRVFIEYDIKRSHKFQPDLTKTDGSKFYPTGRITIISAEKARVLFGKEGDAEPISFFDKETFKMVFDTPPEISCFWCGKPFNGVKSAEKRLKAIESYEPCDACKEKWKGECVVFECDYKSDKAVDGVVIICEGKPMHPTGRLMRVDPKEIKRIMNKEDSILYVDTFKFRVLSGEDKLDINKAKGEPIVDMKANTNSAKGFKSKVLPRKNKV